MHYFWSTWGTHISLWKRKNIKTKAVEQFGSLVERKQLYTTGNVSYMATLELFCFFFYFVSLFNDFTISFITTTITSVIDIHTLPANDINNSLPVEHTCEPEIDYLGTIIGKHKKSKKQIIPPYQLRRLIMKSLLGLILNTWIIILLESRGDKMLIFVSYLLAKGWLNQQDKSMCQCVDYCGQTKPK